MTRDQLPLFDRAKAEAKRDEAIAKVHRGAPSWVEAVVTYIGSMPAGSAFTTDDLWRRFDQPPEPRAMGAAIKTARGRDLIRPTGRYTKSARPDCHARPVAEWVRI